ncbi:hypothetical protein AB0J83_08970 [Actinoplanes sp. NPDC049596]|uniref:hypothetical protein n=1 Tax=unclassified Actinoplanes TaxID=2626549 RepID=UPI00344105C8
MDEIMAATEIPDYPGVWPCSSIKPTSWTAHLSGDRARRTLDERRWAAQRPHRIQEDEQQ